MMQKPGTPSSMPTKSTIFNWIKQIVPDANTKMKVEDLGDGVVYCKIMNHYFPGSISLNRLNNNPKNQYDYSLNLKLFQNSLTVHKITVPFDVGKIAKQKFLQNWGLINALYRQLSSNNEESATGQDSKYVSVGGPKCTPKRSFQTAFPAQQNYKLPDVQPFVKPVYNHSNTQPTVHYQNNQMYVPQIINSSQHSQQEQSRIQTTNQLFSQSPNVHQNLINHTSHQNNGASIINNSVYHNSGITQSAFGGFNFGMTNNINSLNLNPMNNSSLSFSRGQTLINRDPVAPQSNNNSVFDQQTTNKCWSVGKLPTRQSIGIYAPSQQNSGKYSVNSHIFQNNYNAVIDRVKQILLKNSHDIEKIRQVKILLNIPLNEDIVKIQEQQNVMINCTNIGKSLMKSATKQISTKFIEHTICTKQSIEGSKQNIELPEVKSSKQILNNQSKQNQCSKSISNSGSCNQVQHKTEKSSFSSRIPQSSGKKIKNNFFGEGAVFRK